MKKDQGSYYIFVVVLLALALRLIGINHGLPFVFHPDEPTIVRSALGIRFNPNPDHFDWPHLYMYANYVLYMGFSAVRKLIVEVDLVKFFPAFIFDDNVIFYLLTRCFSAFLGALTVIPVYKIGETLFNKKTGFLAALALAVFPYHVLHAHYSLPDVPMLFLFTCSLYFAAKIFKHTVAVGKGLFSGVTSESFKIYAESGFLIGLSASTKYNGGLGVVFIILAHLLRVLKNKEPLFSLSAFVNLCFAGLGSMVGFFLGTPYALLDYKTFLRTDGPAGAMWQFTNVGSTDFGEHMQQLWQVLRYKLPDDFGYLPFIAFFIVLVLWLSRVFKQKYELALIILPVLLYIWYVSGFSRIPSHYFFIIYPFIALSFGFLSYMLFEKFPKTVYLLPALYFVPLYFALLVSYRFYNGDTRLALYKYVLENKAVFMSGGQIFVDGTGTADMLKAAKIPYSKGKTAVVRKGPGYAFLSSDDKSFSEKFELFGGKNVFGVLEETKNFDNKYHLGPQIKVFKFNRQ